MHILDGIWAEIRILYVLPAAPDHVAGQWPLCPASFTLPGGLLTPTVPSAETVAWPGLALLAGSAGLCSDCKRGNLPCLLGDIRDGKMSGQTQPLREKCLGDKTLYYLKNYFDISVKLFAPKCACKALLPTPTGSVLKTHAKGAPSVSEDTVCSLQLSDQGEQRSLSLQMLTDSCSLQLAGSLCSLNKDLAGAR